MAFLLWCTYSSGLGQSWKWPLNYCDSGSLLSTRLLHIPGALRAGVALFSRSILSITECNTGHQEVDIQTTLTNMWSQKFHYELQEDIIKKRELNTDPLYMFVYRGGRFINNVFVPSGSVPPGEVQVRATFGGEAGKASSVNSQGRTSWARLAPGHLEDQQQWESEYAGRPLRRSGRWEMGKNEFALFSATIAFWGQSFNHHSFNLLTLSNVDQKTT